MTREQMYRHPIRSSPAFQAAIMEVCLAHQAAHDDPDYTDDNQQHLYAEVLKAEMQVIEAVQALVPDPARRELEALRESIRRFSRTHAGKEG